MLRRIIAVAVLAGLLAGAATSGARAQQPISGAQQNATASGWTFNVAPYLWMPSMDTSLKFNLPALPSGSVTANSSYGFGDLLSHMNSGVMFAADAQYDRFSILTDFIYLNLGAAAAHFRSLNLPGVAPIPIAGAVQTHVGLNLNGEVWTLAGGYTVAQGDWGRLDVVAGLRLLQLNVRLNYNLAVTFTGPAGQGPVFGGNGGSLAGSTYLWNGIGGVRGRIRLADTGLFIPYYVDAGAGASKFTWQIASGLGYHLSWGDLSLTYRYLTFEQNKSALLQRVSMYGPMIMLNIPF